MFGDNGVRVLRDADACWKLNFSFMRTYKVNQKRVRSPCSGTD